MQLCAPQAEPLLPIRRMLFALVTSHGLLCPTGPRQLAQIWTRESYDPAIHPLAEQGMPTEVAAVSDLGLEPHSRLTLNLLLTRPTSGQTVIPTQVGNIDTRGQRLTLELYNVLYWTDPRLFLFADPRLESRD